MNVLVGIDGSECSLWALERAVQLLDPSRDRLVLVHVPAALPRSITDPEAQSRARAELSEGVFSVARQRIAPLWLNQTEFVTGTGSVRQALLDTARQARADLVVVGAHGSGGWTGALLGSVARAVARAAEAAVLVVRGERKPPAPWRVLFASDGSPSGDAVAAWIRQLRWPSGSACHLLSAIEPLDAGEIPAWLANKPRDPESEAMSTAWVAEHESEKNAASSRLQAFAKGFDSALTVERVEVREGAPAAEIVRVADEWNADLWWLGARGHTAVSRLLIGSVTEQVLDRAPASVLVVHLPATE